MATLAFLPSFIALFHLDTLFICEDYLQDKFDPTAQEFQHLWLHKLDPEEFENLSKFAGRRSDILILCSSRDIPKEFSFHDVPREMTFLFEDKGDLSNLNSLRLDSKVFGFSGPGNMGDVEIIEYYQIKSGPLIARPLCTWTASNGNFSSDVNVKTWEMRGDLMGADLMETWLPWAPFTFFNEDSGQVDGKISYAL